jgi:hypothetical protein
MFCSRFKALAASRWAFSCSMRARTTLQDAHNEAQGTDHVRKPTQIKSSPSNPGSASPPPLRLPLTERLLPPWLVGRPTPP